MIEIDSSEAFRAGESSGIIVASRDSHKWANFSGNMHFILRDVLSEEALSHYEIGSDEWGSDFINGACKGAIQQVRDNLVAGA